jgi:hypothetical protein
MDVRHHQRFSACISSHTRCIRDILSSPIRLLKLARTKRTLLKVSFVPFAVLTSTIIDGLTSKAYAATSTDAVAVMGLPKVHPDRTKITNPLEPAQDAIQEFNNTISSIKEWWHDLPNEIASASVELMSWTYDLASQLILKTPLWLFDNQWFENTTFMFTLLSLGLVSLLTAIEGIKRMIYKKKRGQVFGRTSEPMTLKDIIKRWFIVAGVTTAVPFVFQKAFQGLNAISDFFISVGAENMKNVALPAHIGWLDVVTLSVFDIVLLSTLIPVLWKNARRFFDIMVLGVVSPMALTAWIFDPYRHYFTQWWGSLKHLSMVQVYYSLFLLILGLFIFGVPTPSDFYGLLVKMLVVIGGFARMTAPPRIISKHLDAGGGLDETVPAESTYKRVKNNYIQSKVLLGRPVHLVKKAYSKIKSK